MLFNPLSAASQYIGAPKLAFTGRRVEKSEFYYFFLITKGLVGPCEITKNNRTPIYQLTVVKRLILIKNKVNVMIIITDFLRS